MDGQARLRYWASPSGRRSARTLRALRDVYQGQRAFILGNGPSIGKMDLRQLRGEFTFALNRGYLLFDRMGFAATFLVAVNRYVLMQSGAEIAATPCLKFISWSARRAMPPTAEAIFIRRARGPAFCTDLPREGAWEGATVTYVALQLAHYLGFREVILLGIDHSFATAGRPHTLITSQGADPNHFDPTYFGPGYRWQLPDLRLSETAYRLARGAYERDGRRVVDATVDGKLEVFEKQDLAAILGER